MNQEIQDKTDIFSLGFINSKIMAKTHRCICWPTEPDRDDLSDGSRCVNNRGWTKALRAQMRLICLSRLSNPNIDPVGPPRPSLLHQDMILGLTAEPRSVLPWAGFGSPAFLRSPVSDKCEINVSMNVIKPLIRWNIDDTMAPQWRMMFTSAVIVPERNLLFQEQIKLYQAPRWTDLTIFTPFLGHIVPTGRKKITNSLFKIVRLSGNTVICGCMVTVWWLIVTGDLWK